MRQLKKVLPILTAVSLLASCNTIGRGTYESRSEVAADSLVNYAERKTKYVQDDTTDVLVDAEIRKEDIRKIVKHGDHWHVFTKDGREHITYTDPNAAMAVEDEHCQGHDHEHCQHERAAKGQAHSSSHKQPAFVDVVSLAKLASLPITSIKKHGDHYHCWTNDGTEYITYENPSSAFPNIKIGTYVGNHGQAQGRNIAQNQSFKQGNMQASLPGQSFNNKANSHGGKQGKSLGTNNNDPNRVVKILQHGDHWHVYTAAGREFITYSDPSSQYPDAYVGVYHGSHGPVGGNGTIPNNVPNEPSLPYTPNIPDDNSGNYHKPGVVKPDKPSSDNNNGFIETIEPKDLASKGIVKILQHEDHWHCYDANNKEYVVMGHQKWELKYYCPNAEFGQYTGKHSSDSETEKPDSTKPTHNDKCPIKVTKLDKNNPKAVAKLLKHGDHWHTLLVDGSSGPISFCPDLQKYYPDAEVGEYTGSISEEDENATVDDKNNPNVLDAADGIEQVQKFLASFYGVNISDVTFELGIFKVKTKTQTLEINPNLLELKDGSIVLRKGQSLPAIIVDEVNKSESEPKKTEKEQADDESEKETDEKDKQLGAETLKSEETTSLDEEATAKQA